MSNERRNERRQVHLWHVIRAIGKVTFQEIIRDKILYNVVVISALLFGAGILASRLTFIRTDRVITDFGMSAVNLASALLSVLLGAVLLPREFDRRTFTVSVARPISRFQFVIAKYFGLCMVLFLNWLLLAATFVAIRYSVGGGMESTLLKGLVLLLFQSGVLAAIVIFFSTFSTTSLSVIMGLGFYLVGNNISQVRLVAEKSHSSLYSSLLNLSAMLLPNFENFTLGNQVTYNLPVSFGHIFNAMVYGVSLIGFFIVLSGFFISGREK